MGFNEVSSSESSDKTDTPQRDVSIGSERFLNNAQTHYGVLDIGSNSIRLVVYDDLSRAPFPRFNEKAMVALGAGLDADGNFTEQTIARALHAIMRLHAIAKAMEVDRIDVLATEAMRRAGNGRQLIDAIRDRTALETRILSGEEEAWYSAYGVISGFYKPSGVMGDIGGGSLEVAEVLTDTVGENKVSMPLGALPVTEKLKDGYGSAKKWVDGILSESLPKKLTAPVFYAVGGGWRALARIHIAMHERPVSVVQGYELPADELRQLARDIAKMSPEEVAQLPDVPNRRITTLPASALVMSRVLRALKPERVAFSAYGLREGWLYRQLDEQEQYRDPLIESAQAIGLPMARVPAFSEALCDWTKDLFPDETLCEKRLRVTVCALTDIAWREHEKIRAKDSLMRMLQFPFIGISHPERAFVSVAILARYGGKVDEEVQAAIKGLMSDSELQRAEILGRTLLLGHRFSASVPQILSHARIVLDDDTARLVILDSGSVPDSDAVQTRLRQLAKVAGLSDAEIVGVED